MEQIRTSSESRYNLSQVRVAACILLALSALSRAADPPEQVLRHAIEAHQAGRTAEAVRLYREFLAVHPEIAEIHSNLGAALAKDGQYESAVKEYRLALPKLTNNPGLRLNLGLAYYKLGRPPLAAAEFEAVRAMQPDFGQATLLLADCYLQMGKNKQVIELLAPLEQKGVKDSAIDYMLGTALLNDGQSERAQSVLDRILRKGDSAEAALLLGASKYANHDNKAAADDLARAIKLNPDLPGVHGLYALALKESGDTDAATEQFREELKRNPWDYVANIETSLILKQEGKLDDALAHLENALRVRPNDAAALYQRATVHGLQGVNDKARAELEQLTKEYPNFTEAHVSLATIYYRLKRKEDGDRERATVRRLQEEEQKRLADEQSGTKPDAGAAPAKDSGQALPKQ